MAGNECILKKIDQAYGNLDWFNAFFNCTVTELPFFFSFSFNIYIYIGINGRSEGAEVPGITEQLHQIHMYQCLMKNNSGCFMQSSLWRKSYVLLIR